MRKNLVRIVVGLILISSLITYPYKAIRKHIHRDQIRIVLVLPGNDRIFAYIDEDKYHEYVNGGNLVLRNRTYQHDEIVGALKIYSPYTK